MVSGALCIAVPPLVSDKPLLFPDTPSWSAALRTSLPKSSRLRPRWEMYEQYGRCERYELCARRERYERVKALRETNKRSFYFSPNIVVRNCDVFIHICNYLGASGAVYIAVPLLVSDNPLSVSDKPLLVSENPSWSAALRTSLPKSSKLRSRRERYERYD